MYTLCAPTKWFSVRWLIQHHLCSMPFFQLLLLVSFGHSAARVSWSALQRSSKKPIPSSLQTVESLVIFHSASWCVLWVNWMITCLVLFSSGVPSWWTESTMWLIFGDHDGEIFNSKLATTSCVSSPSFSFISQILRFHRRLYCSSSSTRSISSALSFCLKLKAEFQEEEHASTTPTESIICPCLTMSPVSHSHSASPPHPTL